VATDSSSFPSAAPEVLTQLRDEELLALTAQGDPQALAAIYDRYGRLVFSIALHVTDDRLSAEEVTQDVFQIVWRQAGTFRTAAGSLGAWITGITRHRAIDEIRSKRYKSRRRDLWIDNVPVAQLREREGFEQQAVLRTEVRTAVAGLPADNRRAIELAYFGGLTGPEIAASLGIPLGTVKTRLRLGLVRLRTALLPGWETEEGTED
jgi:RNA polymerase sigma-70 factor (ECF subfamily)